VLPAVSCGAASMKPVFANQQAPGHASVNLIGLHALPLARLPAWLPCTQLEGRPSAQAIAVKSSLGVAYGRHAVSAADSFTALFRKLLPTGQVCVAVLHRPCARSSGVGPGALLCAVCCVLFAERCSVLSCPVLSCPFLSCAVLSCVTMRTMPTMPRPPARFYAFLSRPHLLALEGNTAGRCASHPPRLRARPHRQCSAAQRSTANPGVATLKPKS